MIFGAWGDYFLPVAKFFAFRRVAGIKSIVFGLFETSDE